MTIYDVKKQKTSHLPKGTKNLLILSGIYILSSFVVPYNGDSTNAFYVMYAVTTILLLIALSTFFFFEFILQERISVVKSLISISVLAVISTSLVLFNVTTIGVLTAFAASLVYMILAVLTLVVDKLF